MGASSATLEDVVATPVLLRRPERRRDLARENAALRRLMHQIPRALSPLDILLETALEFCEGGSAGVSVLETSPEGGRVFRWVALAGALAPHVGGTTPADFSPCGVTLARGSTQLFSYPERVFTYFAAAEPRIVEGLVIPFVIDQQAGTIWVVSHDPGRQFTAGDAGFMAALADFTATALSLQASVKRERDAREMAEDANRLKDEFLATVCHELRTPLNSIVGWSELLAEGDLADDERAEAVSSVREAATRQSHLVEDLLDMSRIVSGGLEIDCDDVDFDHVIQGVADAVRPLAEAHGIRLTVHVDLPSARVTGDAVRLQQALANVLTNAVKFTASSGTIDMRLTGEGTTLALRVSDSGIGINAEFLPFVFDRFRQADSTPRRRVGGLGLGLAIALEIIEKHGGAIRAESAGPGQGASFTITLPWVHTTGQVDAPSQRRLSPGVAGRLDHVRVLLVDDDDDAREVIGVLLRQRGAEVQVAASGREGLALLDRWRPDVLLSDIAMPGEDGYEFIRQVRRDEAGRPRLRAAALTACATPAERERALIAGFDVHLTKPITGAQLAASVASLLKGTSNGQSAAGDER